MSRKKTQNKTNIVLERISDYYHLHNDTDIARFYGVSESTISSWRTRDKINQALIRAKCNDDNLANWFIDGIKTQNNESPLQNVSSVNDSNVSYNASHPVSPVKISELISKTAVILESQSTYSIALKSNIIAFHHAVTCEEQLNTANKRIDSLEEHVKSIESRLHRKEEKENSC